MLPNSIPSIFNQLQLFHIYFWSGLHHDQTCRSTIDLLVHYILLCGDFQFSLFNFVMTTAPRWRLQKFLLTVYLNYETCVYILVRWSSPMPSVYLALSLRLDPHFMLLVYYVYFWWGDHYHRMLSSAQHHYQALSMLFISCCHHHQSTTVDWVYFYKVVIISGHPHNLLTSFYLYNFGKVIIITGRPHDLWTTFYLHIFGKVVIINGSWRDILSIAHL